VVWQRLVDRLAERLRADSDFEWRLAGVVGGALWIIAAIAVLAVPLFPQVDADRYPLWLSLAISGGAIAWGLLAMFVIPWHRAPEWSLAVVDAAAVGLIGFITLRTGGTIAPTRLYVLFTLIYAACFLRGRYATPMAVGAAAVWVMPVVDERGLGDGAAQLALALPIFLVLNTVILFARGLLTAHQRASEALSDEHQAMRIIATAVAANRTPELVFGAAAQQAARLLHADASTLMRFDPDDQITVLGTFSKFRTSEELGQTLPLDPASDIAAVRRDGRTVRVDDYGDRDDLQAVVCRELGYRSWIGAPVHARGRLWGVLAVLSSEPGSLPDDAEDHLSEFAELLSMAIANTEEVERLATDATTDPLTGLANHRAFQERLRAELGRAERHRRALTLALVDVDEFKSVNDAGGHGVGDEVLRAVAAELRSALRGDDVLARLGGDEFAVLLPETGAAEAAAALERARQAIAVSTLPGGLRVTISLGVCDVEHTTDAEHLTRLADGALYWSKEHGRNRLSIYDPETIQELSAAERLAELQRSQALVGIRALARAIDARDPSTSQHSERVAALTARLAEFRGWEPERVARLYDAALVHDVGKLGIPDAILLKPDRLTREEYEIIKTHVELSARIVDDALDAEQVEWILSHHERPDGRGYPRALTAGQLSEGAALMAAADAFDVMTSARPYSPGQSIRDALDEVRSLVDAQFTADAAQALLAVHEDDGLDAAAA